MKRIPDWIFIDGKSYPPTLVCKRCGARRELHVPATIVDALRQGEAFAATHADCKPKMGQGRLAAERKAPPPAIGV